MTRPARTLTRRAFALRAAALTVAAAAGTRLALDRPHNTRPSRMLTYAALVEAVGHATRSQVDPTRTAHAVESLRNRYAGEHAPTRAAIDEVLDRVEATPAHAPFSRLPLADRIAVLRSLDPNPAARADALAAAPFHPPADDYHPTPVVL